VQAKGGYDRIGVSQTRQDIAFCGQKWPEMICRSVAAQFMADDSIAMFELELDSDDLVIVQERHYKLVRSIELTAEELKIYVTRQV
jgi:hypothetical protein